MQACLPIGACDAADAWIAVRQLGEACSQGGKWQQTLDAHDLQVKIREYLHELADRMSQLYDLDFRVRPEGVAERMKEKEQAAAKAREAAMHGGGGGEEEVRLPLLRKASCPRSFCTKACAGLSPLGLLTCWSVRRWTRGRWTRTGLT